MGLIEKEGRALVIAVNKWDLVSGDAGAVQASTEDSERLMSNVKGVQLVPLGSQVRASTS